MSRDLVDRFYRGFADHDGEAMAACYSADIVFEDPVFDELNGRDPGDMWRMLCGSAPDLHVDYTIEQSDELPDEHSVLVRWTARYTFPATGRVVHNEVVATMRILDGRIVDHRDRFSLWTWSSQALGPPGKLLGWSPPFQKKIRRMARRGLAEYQDRSPENPPSPEVPHSPQTCQQCGFNSEDWNSQDTAGTLRLAAPLLQYWAAPLDTAMFNVRPRPEVWSAAEYVDHVRETLWQIRLLIEVARDDHGHDLGPGAGVGPKPPGEHRQLDFQACLEAVAAEAEALWSVLHRLDEQDWANTARFAGVTHSISDAACLAVHDLWHHLTDLGEIAATLGDTCAAHSGSVHQLNLSGGGVPKTPVDAVVVDNRGVVGDVQKTRRAHGRPWQALCLWSSEVIDDLVAEGHTVYPGAAGENITVTGLDWGALHAGVVITIGEVTCQLSAPAAPCAKIRGWFADNDNQRIDHDTHPSFARWYATVLTPGQISTGDRVDTLSPPLQHPSPG